MNQYKKKKNFLQALFEFDWVIGATIFLMVFVAPFFVGLLVMKIPGISVTKDPGTFPFMVWLLGLCGVGVCVAIVGIVLVLIPKATRDFHAAKIMQYLPLTKEDWEQFDAKTDEDAVRVLRNLVKTIGFNDHLISCRELCYKITESYYAFLDFKYGNFDYLWNIDDDVLADVTGLVLCLDSDFDTNLKIERKKSKEMRKQWIANKNKINKS